MIAFSYEQGLVRRALFSAAERKPHILPRRLAIDKSRAFARGRIWGR